MGNLEVPSGFLCGPSHLVEFYETETFLVDTVGAFLAPALREGDAVIVVATADHRIRFEAALATEGIDVDSAVEKGRYLAFDAATLLQRFMVEGVPDRTRFVETVGAVMERASEGGRQIRVYGEMVALLLDQGDVAAALALEDLWNDLAAVREFVLLCAYPMRSFGDEASSPSFNRICEQHTAVIPAEGYSLRAGPTERARAVAELQQQTAALRLEVRRLRRQQGRQESGGGRRDEAGVQRDKAGGRRDQAGGQRDLAGGQRDLAGDERDQAGDERNQAAERRDRAAEARDQEAERSEAARGGTANDARSHYAQARGEAASDRRRASQDRRAEASERKQSKLDRAIALADRGAGASERNDAQFDRSSALADRGASAREREHASHDDLTGAYMRGPGFVELERDMARARRAEVPFVVAFVDVDGLKAVNDSRGHAAGDRMLREVAHTFGEKLRSHDLVIRYGGDEFVCAISGLAIADATKRLALVSAALASSTEHASVTIGLAELRSDDSAEDLVARADAALYRVRKKVLSGGATASRPA